LHIKVTIANNDTLSISKRQKIITDILKKQYVIVVSKKLVWCGSIGKKNKAREMERGITGRYRHGEEACWILPHCK
jgi:hypothetical protein